MKIVLLGAPGSGKGTHAQRLSRELNIPHISTGEIFRKHIRLRTSLGVLIEDVLARGQLVSDEETISVVKDRVLDTDCNNGFILDGFPRSLAQAEGLCKFEKIDCVLNIVMSEQQTIDRLSGRRFCSSCGKVYHTSLYSKDGCDVCDGLLTIRDDDKSETVAKRYIVYHQTTFPLVEYYNKLGILREIDGQGTVQEVHDRILEVVKK